MPVRIHQMLMMSVWLLMQWEPGRIGAHKQLENFINNKLAQFSQHKAKTDRQSTSKLSPHLHYGEIGIRTVRQAILDATKTMDPKDRETHAKYFYRQLGFREYSRYLSFHFPFTHERSMLEHLRAVPWRYDQKLFKAWRTGNTGYPLVDAAMREIWSTGWMHNRCRVVCASFLVKHLLIPWQWGLKHYWDALLDADLECDALGWQYCAGCLSDGHLFSEVMNLEEEVKGLDPMGMYVRRWLPVLARIPTEYIHAPWKAPRQILEDAGVDLGVDYPFPIVTPGEAQHTLSKAAGVVAQAEVELQENSAASGPYRPPTKPLPEASSLIWGLEKDDPQFSSIASQHSNQMHDTPHADASNVLAGVQSGDQVAASAVGAGPKHATNDVSSGRAAVTADGCSWSDSQKKNNNQKKKMRRRSET